MISEEHPQPDAAVKFRLGINYWPATSAMHWWRRFDLNEVEADFSRIREAGFDSVRIFLLWEDFQPKSDSVSQDAILNLVAVADVAARNGLRLIPTLFTGHMSGFNWIPNWALHHSAQHVARFRVISQGKIVEAGLRNWYSENKILDAQALLAREVASALCNHSAVWAWDLGNENSNCVIPESREQADAWLDRMASAIRSVDATHPITIGLHMEDLEEDRKLGPQQAARVCDFLSMHGYPIYADWAASPTDAHLLPFLGLITQWLGDGSDVLFEEFGAATLLSEVSETVQLSNLAVQLLAEDAVAAYVRDSIDLLHSYGFMGALLWCYSDYSEELWADHALDEAIHERFFGLWRSDGRPKAALAPIKDLEGRYRISVEHDFSWIDMPPENFYANPRDNLRRLYSRFRNGVE